MKRLLRYAILVPAALYVWALLPISFRPQYTGSPLRKPDATVNVDVVGGTVSGSVGSAVASASTKIVDDVTSIGLHKLSRGRIKQACEPPGLLKPVVRPALHVTVRYVDNGRVVAQTSYDCNKYV